METDSNIFDFWNSYWDHMEHAAKVDVFDKSAISPGTAFMEHLDQTLNRWLMEKIENDVMWRKCRIIFSGPKVSSCA